MGISGHMLGERRLRRLRVQTGIPFDRAYIDAGRGEGIVVSDGSCVHYDIDPKTMTATPNVTPRAHWTSCP